MTALRRGASRLCSSVSGRSPVITYGRSSGSHSRCGLLLSELDFSAGNQIRAAQEWHGRVAGIARGAMRAARALVLDSAHNASTRSVADVAFVVCSSSRFYQLERAAGYNVSITIPDRARRSPTHVISSIALETSADRNDIQSATLWLESFCTARALSRDAPTRQTALTLGSTGLAEGVSALPGFDQLQRRGAVLSIGRVDFAARALAHRIHYVANSARYFERLFRRMESASG